jgi:hypothetical protein
MIAIVLGVLALFVLALLWDRAERNRVKRIRGPIGSGYCGRHCGCRKNHQ